MTSLKIDSSVWATMRDNNGKYPGDPPAYGFVMYVNKFLDPEEMIIRLINDDPSDVCICWTKNEFEHVLIAGYWKPGWKQQFKRKDNGGKQESVYGA